MGRCSPCRCHAARRRTLRCGVLLFSDARTARRLQRAFADALLDVVVPGGKVVFVDYHRPHRAHPLKGITSLVFDILERFPKSL